ncbi:hypothetical protein MTO96_040156, partial [Rhipicephalus appendiculatus]
MVKLTLAETTKAGNSSGSWPPRRRNMEFGISFSSSITPKSLDKAAGHLDTLRKDGIKHYGLLTVVTLQMDYYSVVSSVQGIIAKLKELQGSDRSAKTVIAFGPYLYSANFLGTIKMAFSKVVSSFMADIVITITSTGWLGYKGFCNAVPPNSIKIAGQGPTVLESHWFAVSASTIISKPSVITGLSFELSALKYVMVVQPTSLKDSVFQPCLSVKKTGQEE